MEHLKRGRQWGREGKRYRDTERERERERAGSSSCMGGWSFEPQLKRSICGSGRLEKFYCMHVYMYTCVYIYILYPCLYLNTIYFNWKYIFLVQIWGCIYYIHVYMKSSFPKRIKRRPPKMSLQCQCQFCRLCFGKELFIGLTRLGFNPMKSESPNSIPYVFFF